MKSLSIDLFSFIFSSNLFSFPSPTEKTAGSMENLDNRTRIDDESDWRAVAFTRMLLLGNPNLVYNAEDCDKTPRDRKRCVELMADRYTGLVIDALIKNVRERYPSLDDLPTRYGIAFCFAYFLRRCSPSETREICPEYYFYSFDDLYKFLGLYRGENSPSEQAPTFETAIDSKGFGTLIKNICQCFFAGQPKSAFDRRRAFENEWQEKVFEKPSATTKLIEICSNTRMHGWTHKDTVKLCHMRSKPWEHEHGDELCALVAWNGAAKALEVIRQEAGVDCGNNEAAMRLIELLRAIRTVKESTNPATITKKLQEYPELCHEIYPGGIVPRKNFMHKEVTAVLALHTPLRQLFHCLPSWQARDYFDSDALRKIAERLGTATNIRDEHLSPVEILMEWVRYQRFDEQLADDSSLSRDVAGLRIDDNGAGMKLSRKKKRAAVVGSNFKPFEPILDAFAAAFATSFVNFRGSLTSKFFIAVDTDRSFLRSRVRGAHYFTVADAVACILSLAVRKETTISAVFSDNGCLLSGVNKSMNHSQILDHLSKTTSGKVSFAAPFIKAAETGSDFFVIITDGPRDRTNWFGEIMDAALRYEQQWNVKTKVVVCFLQRQSAEAEPLPIADNILVINGWNRHVPEVIWSYARGQLDETPIQPPTVRHGH